MPCGRPVLIHDVAVFDGRNPPTKSSVLVRGGLIVEIGERPAVGPECERVDGTGATLLPDLIDAHTHTFCREDLQQASCSESPRNWTCSATRPAPASSSTWRPLTLR